MPEIPNTAHQVQIPAEVARARNNRGQFTGKIVASTEADRLFWAEEIVANTEAERLFFTLQVAAKKRAAAQEAAETARLAHEEAGSTVRTANDAYSRALYDLDDFLQRG